jgi:hypothetical protein
MEPDGIDFVGNSKISSFCTKSITNTFWYFNTVRRSKKQLHYWSPSVSSEIARPATSVGTGSVSGPISGAEA